MLAVDRSDDASFAGDFYRALHLLHSKDPSSADGLRELLDAAIARRDGTCSGTTNRKLKPSTRITLDFENEAAADATIGADSRRTGFKDAKGNDVNGKDEVPRISIPDEDQNDVAACKVYT